MSKIKLTGSNSGYVEIDSAADAGNLTLTLPTSGVRLLSNTDNVFSGITTTGQLDINGSIDVSSTSVFNDDLTLTGASYNVLWDKSDNQLEFGTNAKLSFGASSDFQIYRSGTHTYLKNSSNTLVLNSDAISLTNHAGNSNRIVTAASGEVYLYYSDAVKLVTTNTGVVVTGICTATSFSGSGENLTRTTQLSHRNVIINGAMQVAQRGTSETGITGARYAQAPDRFKIEGGSYGTITASQSTDSPNEFGNSYKVEVTSTTGSIPSPSSYLELVHKIEGQDLQHFSKGTSDAKQYALSFYVKCNRNGTYVVLLIDHDNSRMISKTYTVSDANWNRITLIYPADTSGAFGNDNNLSLSLKFVLVAGTTYTSGTLASSAWEGVSNANSRVGQVNFINNNSNYWQITGIQLEVGQQATPFEHRTFGEELQRCKRYFARHGWDAQRGVQKVRVIPGINEHATNYGLYVNFGFDVEMRATPTVSFGSNVTVGRPQVAVGRRINSTSTGLNSPSGIGFMKWPSSGSYGGQLGTHGDAYYYIKIGNDSNGYIDCSAEL